MTDEGRHISGLRFRAGRAVAVSARLTSRLDDNRWRAEISPPGVAQIGDRLRFGELGESPACLLGFLDAEIAGSDDAPILVFALSGPALDQALDGLATPAPPDSPAPQFNRAPKESTAMKDSDIWAALAATASDAIFAVNRDGAITFWNPGAERIFGYAAAEALGASLDLIIPENLRGRHNAGFAQAMLSETTRYGAGELLSVPARRKDGARLSVEFTVAFVRNPSGAVTGMAAILRDASKHYETLKALRRQLAPPAP